MVLEAPAAATSPAVASSAKIFECHMDGRRVFADSPCGSDAVVREVGEVNRMNPTPTSPRVAYAGYAPEFEVPPEPTEFVATPNTVYLGREVPVYRIAPRPLRPFRPHRPIAHHL
jgi:hypothetical protein